MSGFRALPELDPPETCILVTFALNRSHRGLSYKEWFTPAAKGLLETGNSFQIAFPRAFASQRCPAVYSAVDDNDSPRAPAGCRLERRKETIKVEEPGAKIGRAFCHLTAPSAYAEK